MTPPSSNQSYNAQGSFGSMLQQARKSKQLTLDDAAKDLFILKRHLQALENENFSDMPQAAFARGFAINYAKFLGLDPTKVAASFDAAYPNELKPRSTNNIESPLRPMGTLQRDSHNRIRFNPMLIIAVILLILLVIFLFRMVSTASKESSEDATPLVEEISASEQAQGAAISGQDVVGASGSALNLGGGTAVDSANLTVKVKDAVTILILDSTGNSLMSGAQTSGNYELSGTPPFSIQIDNIDNVALSMNAAPVALTSYATDKQATFELAP